MARPNAEQKAALAAGKGASAAGGFAISPPGIKLILAFALIAILVFVGFTTAHMLGAISNKVPEIETVACGTTLSELIGDDSPTLPTISLNQPPEDIPTADGFSARQMSNAWMINDVANQRGLTAQQKHLVMATAIMESNIERAASTTVPESQNYTNYDPLFAQPPYASEHPSYDNIAGQLIYIGVFQQSAAWVPSNLTGDDNINHRMDPRAAANAFIGASGFMSSMLNNPEAIRLLEAGEEVEAFLRIQGIFPIDPAQSDRVREVWPEKAAQANTVLEALGEAPIGGSTGECDIPGLGEANPGACLIAGTQETPTMRDVCGRIMAAFYSNNVPEGAHVGCYRDGAGGPGSEHPLGRACDFAVNQIGSMPDAESRAFGDRISGWATEFASQTGVCYVIWDNRIWNQSYNEWLPYGGSGPTNGHYDHVHISVYTEGWQNRTLAENSSPTCGFGVLHILD